MVIYTIIRDNLKQEWIYYYVRYTWKKVTDSKLNDEISLNDAYDSFSASKSKNH